MYGRMYTANTSSAVAAAVDFFEINAPSTAVVIVHRVFLGQSSDAADAQAEMLRVAIQRVGGTAGSGGVAPTPRPHAVGHAASAVGVEAINTTQIGTPTTIFEESFNVQAGWLWVPTPEERIVIPPSGGLVIALPSAPNDSLTMQGSITFEEID